MKQKGISTLELIIAFTLVTIVLSSTVVLLFQAENGTMDGQNLFEGLLEAKTMINNTFAYFPNSFDTAISTSSENSLYQSQVKVTHKNEFTKRISSSVSWLGKSPVTFETKITDLEGAIGGSSCLITDWQETLVGGSLTIPEGIPTSLDARGRYVYMTADSGIATATDLYIIDVNDRSSPVIISSLNTGPGLQDIHVAGNYAYVANTSINSQLQIIDIQDVYRPVLIASYKLPGSYNDGTTIGNTIMYFKDFIYIGTQKSQITELHAIDVSNPRSPREVATWEANAAINSLAVFPPYLFVATPLDNEVTILTLQNLNQVGSYNAPGGSGNGKSLSFGEDHLVLGRTIGGNELYILTASSGPALTDARFLNLNTSINSALLEWPYLFLGTSDPVKKFQVWNITDFLNPLFMNSINFGSKVISLDCDQKTIYAILENSDGLRIIYSK
jgi:hypothetical protein